MQWAHAEPDVDVVRVRVRVCVRACVNSRASARVHARERHSCAVECAYRVVCNYATDIVRCIRFMVHERAAPPLEARGCGHRSAAAAAWPP